MGFKDFIALLAAGAKAQHEAKEKLGKMAKPITPKQAKAIKAQKNAATKKSNRNKN